MSQYDSWKTTNRAAEITEALHATFERSDDFMSAYVDYCDEFVGSDYYERAFEKFCNDVDDDVEDLIEPDDSDLFAYDGDEYYGLHPDDEGDPTYDEYGD